MEFTLREVKVAQSGRTHVSLNPCFCGIYSQSKNILSYGENLECLNPCFCGIYSQRLIVVAFPAARVAVLILVFVEFTLREFAEKMQDPEFAES